MKPNVVRLLLIVLIVSSCKTKPAKINTANNNSPVTIANNVDAVINVSKKEVSDFLVEQDKSSQFFTIKGVKDTLIKGVKGAIVKVKPTDYEYEDGTLLITGINVLLELKELTTVADLVAANAQTVSNGISLISYGFYYINATANGKQLRLKKGRQLLVNVGNIPKHMKLYYGTKRYIWQYELAIE
jgi:hypothetical protein